MAPGQGYGQGQGIVFKRIHGENQAKSIMRLHVQHSHFYDERVEITRFIINIILIFDNLLRKKKYIFYGKHSIRLNIWRNSLTSIKSIKITLITFFFSSYRISCDLFVTVFVFLRTTGMVVPPPLDLDVPIVVVSIVKIRLL